MKIIHVSGKPQPKLGMRHLSVILALGETGSLRAAADQLGVTQSALSHRLKEAERRLGAGLCRRAGRGIVLTPAGQRLKLCAERLIGDLNRAEAEVSFLRDAGITRVAKIGQDIYSTLQWFAPFTDWVEKRMSDTRFEIGNIGNNDSIADLLDSRIDLLITPTKPRHATLLSTPLGNDELVAIAAPDHHWSSLSFVAPQDLVGESFLSYSFDFSPDLELAQFMRPANCYPTHAQKIGQTEAVLEMVAMGKGVSILSAWATQKWINSGEILARRLQRVGEQPLGLPLTWYGVTKLDGNDDDGRNAARQLTAWANASSGFSWSGT